MSLVILPILTKVKRADYDGEELYSITNTLNE